MKLSLIKYPLVASLLTFIASCNIEPYEGDVGVAVNEPGVFKVDFDGQTYIADQVIVTVLDDAINISGLKLISGENFLITLFGNSEGSYPLGVKQNQVETHSITYLKSTTASTEVWVSVFDFTTSQGELVITEIDDVNKTISGTFSFTGYNGSSSKDFTNGTFYKIPYQEGLSGNTNTFFAKVDGVEFVEDTVGGSKLTVAGVPPTIMISATKNNLQTISISLNADIAVGSYTFTTSDLPLGQYNLSLTETYISEAGGVLEISTHDVVNKRIVGTFSFTASPFLTGGTNFEITEGSFDITYF